MARRFLKSNRSIVFSPLESLEAKAASICCVPDSSDNLSSLFPRIATPFTIWAKDNQVTYEQVGINLLDIDLTHGPPSY